MPDSHTTTTTEPRAGQWPTVAQAKPKQRPVKPYKRKGKGVPVRRHKPMKVRG